MILFYLSKEWIRGCTKETAAVLDSAQHKSKNT